MANQVSQAAVEALEQPSGPAHATQVAVEALVQHSPVTYVWLTQAAVEVLRPAQYPVWLPPILVPYGKPTVRGS
jgi:hypothetical protein